MRVSTMLMAAFATAAVAQMHTTAEILADIAQVKLDTQNLTTQLLGPINNETVFNVEIAALNLNQDIYQTSLNASMLPAQVSAADQVMVLQAIEDLYPEVIASLAAYVPVASQLDELIGAGTPESLLMSIQSSSDALAAALITRATGPYVAIGRTLAQDIDNAFNSALSGTVPVAVALPTIPPAGVSTSTPGGSTPTRTSAVTPTSTKGATPTSSNTGIVSPTFSSIKSATISAPIYGGSTYVPVYGQGTSCVETAPVYGATSVPVYGGGSAPVYGGSSAVPTAPVYGGGSGAPTAPVYGGGSGAPTAPVYGGGSGAPTAPVYGGGSGGHPGAPTAPVYGGGSGAHTAPVYGGSTGVAHPSSPAYQGAARQNAAQLGAAVVAAGLAILI